MSNKYIINPVEGVADKGRISRPYYYFPGSLLHPPQVTSDISKYRSNATRRAPKFIFKPAVFFTNKICQRKSKRPAFAV